MKTPHTQPSRCEAFRLGGGAEEIVADVKEKIDSVGSTL